MTEAAQQLSPLVKWIGGKRKLASQIVERLPAVVEGTYFEPFAGAAAVFCSLWNAGQIKGSVVLADHNRDLIALYAQVRDEPHTLLASLRAYDDEYRSGDAQQTEALYYRVRDEWNAGQKTPARFVFLKQTAFNGLWRVNKEGKLNAAWGKYGHRAAHGIDHDQQPCILDEPNIMAWHEALRRVSLFRGDTLAWRMPKPARGDVVYLDPPYVGTFDGYTADGFTDEQQDRLITMAAEWTAEGVVVGYSNSGEAEERVRRLWPVANIEFFSTSYTVNRDPEGRKGKRELFAVSRKEVPVSVVPAVSPPPVARSSVTKVRISASQIETFRLCKRKWAFQKIDRLPSPQNAAAALGEEAHKHRENWLTAGTPPPADTRAGKLAVVGLEHLPPPGIAEVEKSLWLTTQVDSNTVEVSGRIDFFLRNAEPQKTWGELGVPLIGDHKTTASEEWMKSAEVLTGGDPQGAIYGKYALEQTGAQQVDLLWAYMIKSSSPRAAQVRARMHKDQVDEQYGKVLTDARNMLVILNQGVVGKDVEPTTTACEAFGGCPYRDVCPITNQQKIGALMAQGALQDILKLANTGGAAAAAPAAPAPSLAMLGISGVGTSAVPAALTTPQAAVASVFATAPAPMIPTAPAAAPAPQGGAVNLQALRAMIVGQPSAAVQSIAAPAPTPAPAVSTPASAAPMATGIDPALLAFLAQGQQKASEQQLDVMRQQREQELAAIVPPDAPPSDPNATEVEKKRGRPKKSESALPDMSGALVAQLARIADALEKLALK